MLTQVDVFGVQSSSQLTMYVGSVTDLIQIKNIDGLGPVKADIASSSYGVIPGEAITGKSIGKRNIVLTLGLNPDWATQTIEELRKLLYQFFMPGTDIVLQFMSTHLDTCGISGVVESLEPNVFSKDPEIQISVLCGRPDFIAVDETTIQGVVVDNTVTFTHVDYSGSAPTGLNLKVDSSEARGAYTGFITLLLQSDISPQALIKQNFTVNDVTVDQTRHFELNTVPGEKYVRTLTDGNPTPENLLGHVQDPFTWPLLQPRNSGNNELLVEAALPGQAWEISYFTRFGAL